MKLNTELDSARFNEWSSGCRCHATGEAASHLWLSRLVESCFFCSMQVQDSASIIACIDQIIDHHWSLWLNNSRLSWRAATDMPCRRFEKEGHTCRQQHKRYHGGRNLSLSFCFLVDRELLTMDCRIENSGNCPSSRTLWGSMLAFVQCFLMLFAWLCQMHYYIFCKVCSVEPRLRKLGRFGRMPRLKRSSWRSAWWHLKHSTAQTDDLLLRQPYMALYGPYFVQPHLRFLLSMVVFFLLTALHLPTVPAVCYISVVCYWIESVVVLLEMFSISSRLVRHWPNNSLHLAANSSFSSPWSSQFNGTEAKQHSS